MKKIKKTGKKSRNLHLKWMLVILHAFVLVIFTIVLQYTHLLRFDESAVLKWTSLIRHTIFHTNKIQKGDSAVFLDVSKDLALIEDSTYQPNRRLNISGSMQTIVDRHKLTMLFSLLNRHPAIYPYTIFDILLNDKTPEDTIMQPEIEKLKKSIFASTLVSDTLEKPLFHTKNGCVDYFYYDENSFNKMLIYYNDSVLCLPALVAEDIDPMKLKFSRKKYLTFIDHNLAFNTVIPEYFYTMHELRQFDDYSSIKGEAFPNVFYLGEFLNFKEQDQVRILQNKYILVGDFSGVGDMYSTYTGRLPGALILYNVFLTMKNDRVSVSVYWLLMLFAFYVVISYKIIIKSSFDFKEIEDHIKLPFLSEWIMKYISYLGMLILIDIFSVILFGCYLSVFIVASYFTFLELIMVKIPAWSEQIHAFITSFV
jgi:hypothetical protein